LLIGQPKQNQQVINWSA